MRLKMAERRRRIEGVAAARETETPVTEAAAGRAEATYGAEAAANCAALSASVGA